MGNVQGRLTFRFHAGAVQASTDDGASWVSVGGDVGLISAALGAAAQDLTVSGLLGDTDGGYEIEGRILTTAAAPDYTLYINGGDPPAGVGSAGVLDLQSGAVFGLTIKTALYVGSNSTANVSNITFRIRMGSLQGVMQAYNCQSFSRRSTGAECAQYNIAGQFTMAAQITSVGIHSSVAGAIDVGSFMRVRRLGFTT